MVYQG